jgi:hypothetical protein
MKVLKHELEGYTPISNLIVSQKSRKMGWMKTTFRNI